MQSYCCNVYLMLTALTVYTRTTRLKNKLTYWQNVKMTPSACLDIPLDRWRQSGIISIKNIPDKDLDECLCEKKTSEFFGVEDDSHAARRAAVEKVD